MTQLRRIARSISNKGSVKKRPKQKRRKPKQKREDAQKSGNLKRRNANLRRRNVKKKWSLRRGNARR